MANVVLDDVNQVTAEEINRKVQYKMDQLNKDWTNLPKEHNLTKFSASLKDIIEKAGYNEMYGVELVAPVTDEKPAPHTTLIILQKFLRANVDDLEKAKEQLTSALKWRKEYQPLKVRDEVYDKDKFGGLGFVTKVKGASETKNEEDVVSWNIYGAAAKDVKKTFGDTDAFVRWRVALQEITIQQLKLDEATEIVPDYGKGLDPYKAINVHDYLSVSFFRRPQEIKDSSSKIIDMFQRYYPETVSYKYFVNVPLVMQWMMGAMKALMSKDSIQTMTWMTYGSELHKYLGSEVPKEYGGSGAPLTEHALTPNYGAGAVAAPVETKTAEPVPTTGAEPVPATAAEPAEPKVAEPVPTVTGGETTAEVTGKPADKADVA